MTPDFFAQPQPYVRRVMPAGIWWHGRGWLMGGFSPPSPIVYDYFNEVWASLSDNPVGDWSRAFGVNDTGDAPWYGRCYVRFCEFDGEIHSVGGYNDIWHVPSHDYSRVISDHLSLGEGGRRWARWQKPDWEAREDVGLAASDTEMVMFGGVTYAEPHDDGARRAFKDVWKFPLSTKKWELVPITFPAWYKRRSSLLEHHDGWYYIAGGGTASGLAYRSCLRFKIDGTIENLPHLPEERTIAACCKAAGRLWMFFGRGLDGLDRSDYVSLDLANPQGGWTNHGASSVPPRYIGQPIVMPGDPDKIFFIGGATDNVSPRHYYGDVYSFNTSTHVFSREAACSLDIDP